MSNFKDSVNFLEAKFINRKKRREFKEVLSTASSIEEAMVELFQRGWDIQPPITKLEFAEILGSGDSKAYTLTEEDKEWESMAPVGKEFGSKDSDYN